MKKCPGRSCKSRLFYFIGLSVKLPVDKLLLNEGKPLRMNKEINQTVA